MSITEYIAAALGVVNVWLVVRRSVWNYPFALVMVTMYGFVFFHARLYSDTILQVYYFAVNVFGWWYWLKGSDAHGIIRPEKLSASGRLAALAATVVGSVLGGWFFATFTNAAAPWLDAFIAAASVSGQTLMSIRKIENWVWWIAADVVATGLYFWKGLYPTSALYLVFLGLSIAGLISWQRQMSSAAEPAEQPA